MAYRTNVRIVADILNVAYSAEGTNVTNIIRKANISYNRLKQILDILITKGLIELENVEGNNRYIISEKGKKFLDVYTDFYDMAEAFGLKL
ncbi:MAG: DUF4364 family protein [Candidatus Nitrosocaldaceae archaeon]